MKNINYKKFFLVIAIVLGIIILFPIIMAIGYIVYILFFDDVGWCLSEGHGVWDADLKVCRQDCLTWTEQSGCVAITEENIRLKEQGLIP